MLTIAPRSSASFFTMDSTASGEDTLYCRRLQATCFGRYSDHHCSFMMMIIVKVGDGIRDTVVMLISDGGLIDDIAYRCHLPRLCRHCASMPSPAAMEKSQSYVVILIQLASELWKARREGNSIGASGTQQG